MSSLLKRWLDTHPSNGSLVTVSIIFFTRLSSMSALATPLRGLDRKDWIHWRWGRIHQSLRLCVKRKRTYESGVGVGGHDAQNGHWNWPSAYLFVRLRCKLPIINILACTIFYVVRVCLPVSDSGIFILSWAIPTCLLGQSPVWGPGGVSLPLSPSESFLFSSQYLAHRFPF